MSKSISLEDLVALNDEIAGLVRAGVPLELGLAGWARDLPGELGRLAKRLKAAIEQGQSLPQFFAEHDQIPPVYKAIVSAGLKSGRLPAALESMAHTSRHLREVRGAVGLAILYPLIVLLIGYGLFALLAANFLGAILTLYENRPPKFWAELAQLAPFGRTPWALIPPLIVLLVVLAWWFQTRRAMVVDTGPAGRWLRWITVVGRVVQNARTAALAEILALLVQNDVPLHESVVLAAECTGDQHLKTSAVKLSESLKQGGVPNENWQRLEPFPAMLAWLVSSGGSQQAFVAMARHMADTCRLRIARDSQWLRDYLPMWLTVAVGSLVVAGYALTIFLPLSALMEVLSGNLGPAMRIKP